MSRARGRSAACCCVLLPPSLTPLLAVPYHPGATPGEHARSPESFCLDPGANLVKLAAPCPQAGSTAIMSALQTEGSHQPPNAPGSSDPTNVNVAGEAASLPPRDAAPVAGSAPVIDLTRPSASGELPWRSALSALYTHAHERPAPFLFLCR